VAESEASEGRGGMFASSNRQYSVSKSTGAAVRMCSNGGGRCAYSDALRTRPRSSSGRRSKIMWLS
jgi:hypothetical protein